MHAGLNPTGRCLSCHVCGDAVCLLIWMAHWLFLHHLKLENSIKMRSANISTKSLKLQGNFLTLDFINTTLFRIQSQLAVCCYLR